MDGTEIRADIEAKMTYLTRISLKECSKAFVENSTESWIR